MSPQLAEPTSPDAARDLILSLAAEEDLPAPLLPVTVRQYSDDELSLSLTLAGPGDLAAWAEHLDTVSAVEPGPWPIGFRDYQVRVGRLAGLLTVLAAEDSDDETPAGA